MGDVGDPDGTPLSHPHVPQVSMSHAPTSSRSHTTSVSPCTPALPLTPSPPRAPPCPHLLWDTLTSSVTFQTPDVTKQSWKVRCPGDTAHGGHGGTPC